MHRHGFCNGCGFRVLELGFVLWGLCFEFRPALVYACLYVCLFVRLSVCLYVSWYLLVCAHVCRTEDKVRTAPLSELIKFEDSLLLCKQHHDKQHHDQFPYCRTTHDALGVAYLCARSVRCCICMRDASVCVCVCVCVCPCCMCAQHTVRWPRFRVAREVFSRCRRVMKGVLTLV